MRDRSLKPKRTSALSGKNGYVFFEPSFYDSTAHDRSSRLGPILPFNRNLHNDPSRELVVVWFRTNETTGVAWGSDPVRYNVNWQPDGQIVIASCHGTPIDRESYPEAKVYHQPDPNLAGYNPNEEHALILPSSGVSAASSHELFALRCDLNDVINPKASEPYVLVKYLAPDATNDWRIAVFQLTAEDASHTFANFTNAIAGDPVEPPAPLFSLAPCSSSNRIAFGLAHAHQVWNGRIYAKSSGYFQAQFWYPTREDFYFGTTNPPVGSCVPCMSQYSQATVSPGTAHVLGEPVLVGYHVTWPSNVAELQFAETLTTAV